MRRKFSFVLSLLLCAGLLGGCSENGRPAPSSSNTAPSSPSASDEISLPSQEDTESLDSQEETEETPESQDVPVVYMTTDISPEGLMAVYEALGAALPDGNIAVKLSTGETGSNYLRPELIGELVQTV